MDSYYVFGALVAAIVFVYVRYLTRSTRRRRRALKQPFPDAWREILEEWVRYYAHLNDERKRRFEKRIRLFLANTRVVSAEVEIDDKLRLLVAASAVIPVFGFDDWEYRNLAEVIVVPNKVEAERAGEDLGVGTVTGQIRPFQRRYYVKLSKTALEAGFRRSSDGHNVGVHEFAHLIDQVDGDVDGLPSSFLSPELLRSWTRLMHHLMDEIKRGKGDLDAYASTGEEEFFAVATEYFFERPNELAEQYPKLYELLTRVFQQNPRRWMRR
ncbi:MAG: M90 family metallopeptidase [Catalinimonas sp.]